MWVNSFANTLPFHLKKYISISKGFFLLGGGGIIWHENFVFKLKYKENNLQACLVILWENVYPETIQNHLKVDLETMVPNMYWGGGGGGGEVLLLVQAESVLERVKKEYHFSSDFWNKSRVLVRWRLLSEWSVLFQLALY